MEDTQLKKGILPLCVLSSLIRKDSYGYEITSTISEELSVKSATIYLILYRFTEMGFVTSYYVEQEGKPSRKYYSITKKGRDYHKKLKDEWNDFQERARSLIQ